MACTHIQSCELFVQFALNPALEIWKSAYCNGEFKSCVRYETSSKGQVVPLSLLPNGKKITINRSQDEMVTTALFNCIAKNRLPMARSLIKTVGVDIDACNVEGTTALMAAVDSGSIEMIELLLSLNPDTSLTNIHGQTAYDLAVEKNDSARIELLAKYQ
jgi:ankyrin repeat protein